MAQKSGANKPSNFENMILCFTGGHHRASLSAKPGGNTPERGGHPSGYQVRPAALEPKLGAPPAGIYRTPFIASYASEGQVVAVALLVVAGRVGQAVGQVVGRVLLQTSVVALALTSGTLHLDAISASGRTMS